MTVAGASPHAITLGLFPSSRGMGWAAFNSPFSIVDFGLITEFERKDQACLDKAAQLFAKHEPQTVVLEAFEGRRTNRCTRIRLLSRAIQALAGDRSHDVAIYSRDDVRFAFADTGATTRDEVAAAVARRVPALLPALPPRRKPYESEDKRLAIFNAAALVLAHYQNGATALLNELRDAA